MSFRNRLLIGASISIFLLQCASGDATSDSQPEPTKTLVDAPANRIQLNIQPVIQAGGSLSSSACIEMVFHYWGEKRYSQYDIARALVWNFKDAKKYVKSHTLFQIRSGKSAEEMDWSSFPGTGTYYAGEFLKSLGNTKNPRIQNLPRDPGRSQKLQDQFFKDLKIYLSSGIPVIVHQWIDGERKDQTFRVVTGYDDSKEVVFLNDPVQGAMELGYGSFLGLWKVDQEWLAYHYIAFNVPGEGYIPRGEMSLELKGPAISPR